MTVAWALLLPVLVSGEATVATVGISGQHESLSRPATTTWSEGSLFGLVRTSGWSLGISSRAIERFSRRDGEASAWVTREDSVFGWEVGVLKGFETGFLPDAGAWGTLRHRLGRGWSASAGLQVSSYPGLNALQPRISLEGYVTRWRLDIQGSGMFADDAWAGAGGRILAEYSWSDETSTSGLLASGAEAERSGQGTLQTTRVTSLALGVRRRIASRTTLRGTLGWIRQGPWHDRTGVSLGLAHDFGG